MNNEYFQSEQVHSGKELGEITDVFKEGKVICIYSNKIPIKTGDVLIGKNESTIVKAKVLGLELDDKKIELADDQHDYELGIELDERFRKNFKVFLVSSN